ncbi:MAG: hypothetical protein ABIS67_11905 [Candidatus Eisenbacteria bacterium]
MNTFKPFASQLTGISLLAALGLLSGCNKTSSTLQAAGNAPLGYPTVSSRSVRSGTTIHVALGSHLSSKTAKVGDSWTGTVTENVMNQDESVIPPGSTVDGVVTAVLPDQEGSPPMLALGIRGIRVDGHDESIVASAEPVIAGTAHARNLGAITGEAANGVLIGNFVGGRDGAMAAPIDADSVAGVVSAGDGYQLMLFDGTVISFTVSQTVAMR